MKTPLCAENALNTWPLDGIEHLTKCPVCGGADYSILHQNLVDHLFGSPPGPWEMQACNSCGSAFLNPRPSKKSIYIAYENYYTHDNYAEKKMNSNPNSIALNEKTIRWPIRQLLKSIFQFLPIVNSSISNSNRHLPRASQGNDQLLDIGCGDGRFMHFARQLGWSVEGVDPDEHAIAVCIRDGLNAKVGDIDSISSETKLYDFVTCSHVIEHIHDPDEFIRLISARIRVGGTFWLETPNIHSLGHEHFKSYWRGLEPPRHLVLFNVTSLTKMLESHGYSVEQMRWNFRQFNNVYQQSAAARSDNKKYTIKDPVMHVYKIFIGSILGLLDANIREFITLKCIKR